MLCGSCRRARRPDHAPRSAGILRSDLDAPKKQRRTARRILARLVDEHGAAGLSYSTVRDDVRKRRRQILAEAGRPLDLGFVPQTPPPAAEAVKQLVRCLLGEVVPPTGELLEADQVFLADRVKQAAAWAGFWVGVVAGPHHALRAVERNENFEG
jgi:hypothetical protein